LHAISKQFVQGRVELFGLIHLQVFQGDCYMGQVPAYTASIGCNCAEEVDVAARHSNSDIRELINRLG
jgi:hypothetical protein